MSVELKGYTAITIGPIYKVLMQAKKLRHIWLGSYLFSHIMRELILSIEDKEKIILPSVTDKDLFRPTRSVAGDRSLYEGAGFFHDRIILHDDDRTLFDKIDEMTKDVIRNIEMAFSKSKCLTSPVSLDFIQFHAIHKQLDTDENPILHFSRYLDTLELSQKALSETSLRSIDTLMHCANHLYIKDIAFFDNDSFPTIESICAGGLIDSIVQEDDDEFDELSRKIEEDPGEVPKTSRYIAVVQADGDNIGKLIHTLPDEDAYRGFSEQLLGFAKQANSIVKKHDGFMVYAGGDDLLFFAPLLRRLEVEERQGRVEVVETVFDLLEELRDVFSSFFTPFHIIPTLSFGVSVNYFKYPMGESLKRASTGLFEKAKESRRDNISFELMLHSGQRRTLLLHGQDRSKRLFLDLLSMRLINKEALYIMSIPNKILQKRSEFASTFLNCNTQLLQLFHHHFEYATKSEVEQGLIDLSYRLLVALIGEDRENAISTFVDMIKTIDLLVKDDLEESER